MGTQSSLGDSSGVLSMLVLVSCLLGQYYPWCRSLQPWRGRRGSPDHVPGAPRMPTGQPVPSGGGDAQVAARLPGGGWPVQTAGNGQKHTIHPFKQKSRTEIEARLKRQSVIDPTSTVNTEVEVAAVPAEQGQNIDASKTEGSISSSRSVSFSSAIARVLAAAGAGPSIIDPDKRSYGKRRRRSPQIEPQRKNAHHFGLKAPKVDQVKVKSHGSFGREVHAPVIVVKKDHTNFLNGAKERRKRSDNFIPFSVYDDRRRKTLKIEENDARALPLRLQIEKKEQLARQAKALALKNEKSSKTQ